LNCTLYVVALVVAGLSRKMLVQVAPLFANAYKGIEVKIVVAPRTNRIPASAALADANKAFVETMRILFVFDCGVIVIDKPVMSVNVALVDPCEAVPTAVVTFKIRKAPLKSLTYAAVRMSPATAVAGSVVGVAIVLFPF